MAFHLRLASSRLASRVIQSRGISHTSVIRNEASPNLGPVLVQKKPIGGFRGGIIGFLLGFSLASSIAAYQLLDEYQKASAVLQASVEELKLNTDKVAAHVRRIEAVEKDLKALADSSSTKEDTSRLRAEVKSLYDGLHVEFLDLRAHVWGIQQDIHKLSQHSSTEVKV